MSELMKCGHTANATRMMSDGTKQPVCFICDCTEIAPKPDLTGRMSKCIYCGKTVDRRNNETHYPELLQKDKWGQVVCGSIVPSSYDLPFFEYRPNDNYDKFYCGCQSWN